MKTSNKLLIGLIGFIAAFILLLVIFGRFSMESIAGNTVKGNGNLSEEIREVESFSGLKISNGMSATLTKGNPSLTVKAESNVLEFIETTVEDGVLKIRRMNGTSLDLNEPVSIDISLPTLTYLSVSHSSNITISDDFSEENVEINASSGSEITMQGLTATYLKMDLSSSSVIKMKQQVSVIESVNLNLSSGSELTLTTLDAASTNIKMSSSSVLSLSGSSTKIKADLSSGSELKGAEFSVQTAILAGSSSSSFEIAASDILEANLSSGSEVRYRGNAQVTEKLSSGSTVRKVD